MIIDLPILTSRGRYAGNGYIAGTGSGIVTVYGQPAKRRIWLLAVETMQVIDAVYSTASGNYLFAALNPDYEYLVLGRDNLKQYEPVAWDFVKPATDKTVVEQIALWKSWQT